jgi:hypothetical protein
VTTAAQIKKMVRPLLERHADLILVGRWIYLKRVHHFARAVLIDRTAYAEEFEPRWAVIHLFQAHTSFTLDWVNLLLTNAHGGAACGSCRTRRSNSR